MDKTAGWKLLPDELASFLSLGPAPAADREKRRRDILLAVNLFTFVSNTLFIGICLIVDPSGLRLLIAALAAFSIAWMLTPLVGRFGLTAAATYLWLTIGLAHTTYVVLAGSDIASHYFLLAGPPIIVMVLGPGRLLLAAFYVFIYLALFLFCQLWLPARSAIVPLPEQLATSSMLFCVITSVLINFLVALYGFYRAEAAEDALEAEHRLSERLLLDLVPQDVARRLKDRPGEIIADDLAEVTILFADIVGFTPRASRLPARETVAFLDSVFLAFDRLCARHGLEKIKTIGDAYMVAGGLPQPQPGHAARVADMALDMMAAAEAISERVGETVSLRIGIHSGPVVAGVIGARKPFYDVWGDTVNTAAHMESHGEPGRIQVTPQAKRAIGAGYRFERAGPKPIKGKGAMRVYYLVGRA